MLQSEKHLETCNKELKAEDNESPYVYIFDRLPIKLQQQRKNILSLNKEAKEKNQKKLGKLLTVNTVCM